MGQDPAYHTTRRAPSNGRTRQRSGWLADRLWRALPGLAAILAPACVIPISTTPIPDGGAPGAQGTAVPDAGLPAGSWTNVTANLANMASQCGNMSDVSAKPDEDLLIAGIALDGLWGSRDGGHSWQALGSGPGSTKIVNRASSIVYDPSDSMRYWETGLYNLPGIVVTQDDGNTFTTLGDPTQRDVWTNDLLGVDFTDPNRQTLVAGGHEAPQALFKSTDGGKTWASIAASLPAATNCTFPVVLDAQTYLVGCAGFGGGPSGIHRTTDGGTTWTSVSMLGGNGPPLVASDGSIYWEEVDGMGLVRSADSGKTWVQVAAQGVVIGKPIELPDKRIAALGPKYLLASADHGLTWKPASATLPYFDATGVVYSTQEKAFFIWHFTCDPSPVSVPADAVMRFDFDYQKE
jgi:hypothetical protein